MSGKDDFLKKYELLEEIGKGGMGVVYKARQTSLDRLVAVKMLARELADEVDYVRRFVEEARAIARMRNHENIVEVYDFIETEDSFYIVMEYVEGEPLSRMLRRRGKFPLGESAEIITRVARAIDHAHQAGVIHRDIKPENIILDRRGRVKVMDFGVARLSGASHKTRTGMVLGTPLYMSPEQARGAAVDARSDVYALGVLLYQMTTGKLPFTGDTPIAVAMKHLTEAPAPPRRMLPEMPERMETGILKALEKSPEGRFQTAGELADFFESPAGRGTQSRPADAFSLHDAATLSEEAVPTLVGEAGSAPTLRERERADTGTAGPSGLSDSLRPSNSLGASDLLHLSDSAERNRLRAGDWAIAAALFLLGLLIAFLFWPSPVP